MLKKRLLLTILLILLPACVPRAVIRPAPEAVAIPADTPPAEIVRMAAAGYEGIQGLRASVKVSVTAEGRQTNSFDAVLYLRKPDSVRLTGLAFMGFTAFDAVLTGGKFYFYQPSEGYLYTGSRERLRDFLVGRGVDVDPEAVARSLLFETSGAEGEPLVENTGKGYNVYQVRT
ncbi:MAG TPA: DUF4292 domain-containing protein, partial [Nitrospirota bacterium]|nr:DUF4292 domain-containing protein [Nitrospirota bacterium]